VHLLRQVEADSPKTTVRVLHLQENRPDQELVRNATQRGRHFMRHYDDSDAYGVIQSIQKADWSLIPADYALPPLARLAALTIVHNCAGTYHPRELLS
jgi:hypothetical protein